MHPLNHPSLQVCFSPNNDVLVSGGYDAAVKLWDCRSRSIDAVQVMKPFRDSVTSVVATER
jgi:mitogen-activated protein kinase organizer 1